jgi:cytochrome c-type biogenesis protein
MILAASSTSGSVDTTVFAAFAVGFVSFVSPCVLPLVPGYLSAISGVTIEEMRGEERPIGRVLGPAIIFCLSFTLMFVALGMSATGIGSTLRDHQETLNRIAGWTIVALGVFFVATLFVPRFNKEWRPESLVAKAGTGGPVIAGLAFAVAWTPCVGPTLGSILAAASTSDTVGKGGLLLAFYSLGLAIPFLLTAVAFDRATTAFRWLRDRYVLVTALSGAVLIFMGVLMLSGELTQLNREAQRFLSNIGLDFFYNF